MFCYQRKEKVLNDVHWLASKQKFCFQSNFVKVYSNLQSMNHNNYLIEWCPFAQLVWVGVENVALWAFSCWYLHPYHELLNCLFFIVSYLQFFTKYLIADLLHQPQSWPTFDPTDREQLTVHLVLVLRFCINHLPLFIANTSHSRSPYINLSNLVKYLFCVIIHLSKTVRKQGQTTGLTVFHVHLNFIQMK